MFLRLRGYCSKGCDQNICFLTGSSAFRTGIEEHPGDKGWTIEQQRYLMIEFE